MRGYKIVKRCDCAPVRAMPVVIREKFGREKPTWYVGVSHYGQVGKTQAFPTRKAAFRALRKKCKCQRRK